MATLSLVHAHYDAAHLETVKAEMTALGSPKLRAIDMGDYWQLLEGCHRARAAAELGVAVELLPVDVSGCYDADGWPTDLGECPVQALPGCEDLDLDGASVADLTRVPGALIDVATA